MAIRTPSRVNYLLSGFDQKAGKNLRTLLNEQRNVISGSGATRTLLSSENGSLFVFDRAAGIVVTLPPPSPELFFDFVVATTITSNSATVSTSAATVFLGGSVISIDTDSSNVTVGFVANGTSHVTMAQNGTTTGGRIGTNWRVSCVSSTLWVVTGVVHGTGVVATPFA